MRRVEWPAAFDHLTAISLERVGGVIERDAKQQLDKTICAMVHKQFEPRVVNGAATLDKAAAEYAVPPLVKSFPVTHDIAAIVGFISHHDDYGVPFTVVNSPGNSAAKAGQAGVLCRRKLGDGFLQFAKDVPGRVRTAIIHNHDLVRHVMEAQFQMQMFNGRSNAI